MYRDCVDENVEYVDLTQHSLALDDWVAVGASHNSH
jgi:hypothetical protein